jgi:hypothetical protein
MSAKPPQPGPPSVATAASTIPMGLRILAIILRTLFFGALVAVTYLVMCARKSPDLQSGVREGAVRVSGCPLGDAPGARII